jgi:hypothetical protein
MSFLVDPPLLVATGTAIARLADDEQTARALEKFTAATFLFGSISLYFNAPWMNWFVRLFRCESGRDLMINGKVFRFPHERPRAGVHLASALIFATYPLWLKLGLGLGRRRAE